MGHGFSNLFSLKYFVSSKLILVNLFVREKKVVFGPYAFFSKF